MKKNKFLNNGMVLSGVLAGSAYLLSQIENNKVLTDNINKAGNFINAISEDLASKKPSDFTYNNLTKFYEKHISGNNSTIKDIMNVSESHSINYKNNNLISSIVRYFEMKENPTTILDDIFKDNYFEKISEELSEKFGNDDSILKNQIKGLTKRALYNDDLIKYIDDDSSIALNDDVINRIIDTDKIKDTKDFFKELIDKTSYDAIKDAKDNFYSKQHNLATDSYEIIDNLLKEFNFENLSEKFGTQNVLTSIQNDLENKSNVMTLNDFLINQEKFTDEILKIGDKEFSLKDLISKFAEQDERFGNLIFDSQNLRIDKDGGIINLSLINTIHKNIEEKLAGTIPGKILKIPDRLNRNIGSFNLIRKGTAATILSDIDDNGSILKNTYAQLLNNIYRINDDNTVSKIKETEKFDFIRPIHGSEPRLLREMFGLDSERNIKQNKLLDMLDLNRTTNKNIFQKSSEDDSVLGKISRKITGVRKYNVIDKIFNTGDNISRENAIEYRENLKKLNSIYSSITSVPNKNILTELKANITNKESKEYLDLIIRGDYEKLINTVSDSEKEITNRDLISLIKKKISNRDKAKSILSIKADKITPAKQVLRYNDILSREVIKEVLYKESNIEKSNLTNYNKISVLINKIAQLSSSNKEQIDNLKNLSNWIVLQENGMLYKSNKNEKILNAIIESNTEVAKMLTYKRNDNYSRRDISFLSDMQNNIKNIKKNYKNLTMVVNKDINADIKEKINYGDVIPIRKGYSPKEFALDIINNLNNEQKMKASAKKFGMQFIAGSKTPEYVTKYSLMPYFFVDRLMQPFNALGLGFSSKSKTDTINYAYSILAKRVAPIALGITAYNYLNFEARNFTGTSLNGAFVQGLANVDLGIRKLADITGVSNTLKSHRKVNPITRYWFGDKYYNAEERKKYYESGYSPVRKGRFWSFGSASEFRGGKIIYYQPSLVRRVNSDWKNETIYGGENEKWKHSWIPTPRHPLAPIRRFLDPYWLEKRNYDTMPYMQTAPLFSAGTPWGAILNPTLGRAIKPVKNMHRTETRFGLTDPRMLIEERNTRIKQKAINKKKANVFQVSQKGIKNVNEIAYPLADTGKISLNLLIENGKITNKNIIPDINKVQSISAYQGLEEENIPQQNTIGNGSGGTYSAGGKKSKSSFGFFDFLSTTKLGSQISNSIGYSNISTINQSIKNRAANNKNAVYQEQGNLNLVPSNIYSQKINTKQDEIDLLSSRSNYDYINDVLFSGKQLGGIYGFLFDAGKSKKRIVRKENANNMASFTRSFWDANIGGLGGDVMEIARRFFPHENHDIKYINPIRNKMPEWMPIRFQVGNPYTKVQKGEMRLPGKGYEKLNKLHSDRYGKYGALDRFKILADVAPWSDEYKLWRQIAKKTIRDNNGKKEIDDILKRVEKQNAGHDFYDYKFLHNPSIVKKEVVTAVNGSDIVTKSGKTYSLAGIKFNDNKTLINFIHPGDQIKAEYLTSDKKKRNVQAAIYLNGKNINKEIVGSGYATESDDQSPMSAKAMSGQSEQLYGTIMEAIGHAPIPFIHNKLMRIDTPLESYKNNVVYGTEYSTWNHPIKGFLKPAFEKAWGRNILGQTVALSGWILAEKMWADTKNTKKLFELLGHDISDTSVNKLASVIMNATNPGAFAGSMIGALPTGLFGSDGLKGLLSLDVFGAGVKSGVGRNFARIGAAIGLAGYGLSRANNPFKAIPLFGLAGAEFAKQFQKPGLGTKEGAMIGAAVGLGISALKNPRFNKEKIFGKYTPSDTKKKWDIEEYFDRLEYMKYSGLYNKAARKAKLFEHVNIKKIFNRYEKDQAVLNKKLNKINKHIERVNSSSLDSNTKDRLLENLNADKFSILNDSQIFKGGKYTKAAIAYKEAMNSTIYGLNKNSNLQQIIKAIPKSEKDYFMQFSKETDKKKQKQILKYVSPYERKALKIAWGYDNIGHQQSNMGYFKHHFMPGSFWAGWTPQVDLDNVKIKTIENEGMLLSDFGLYDSQKIEADYITAPEINNYDKNNANGLSLAKNITNVLNGYGLTGVKVTVDSTNTKGINVIYNVTESMKITGYKIENAMNNLFGKRMFY